MSEEILCPACRHPMRRHSNFGCMANGGSCECDVAPTAGEPAPTPVPLQRPAPRPEPPRAAEPKPEPEAEAEAEPLGGDQLASLLAKAERSGSARMYKQAEKVRQAVVALREMVTGYEKRVEAEREVARLRQQLAEAEARLRQASAGAVPTKAADRGNKSVHLREIREWAWANNVECSAQGRIPGPVMDAYRAAHPGVSA